MKWTVISLICLLGFACAAVAQTPVPNARPEAAVVGRVTLPDGSAAVGAKVEALDPWKQYQAVATATADESAVYTLDVPPGKYSLRASHGIHVYFDPATDLVHVKADAPASGPVDVVLNKGCIIHGSLLDSAAGQMIGGADIYSRNGEHTTTNADGSFQMILPKRRYTLTAVKDGFYQPIMHIDATNRDTLALVVETKPGGAIHGRVTDQQGSPIAGASVGAPSTFFHFQRTVTDGEGRYKLAGLDTDAYTEISASKDGYDYGNASSVSFPPGQQEMTLDFQLQATKTRNITGRVTKPDGSPAAGAKVAYGWTSCCVGYKETTVSPDGRFSLAGVDTTKNVIMAHQDGSAPAFAFVEEGKPAEVALQLKPGHIMEGRFVDESGKPVSGVHISICVEDPVMDKMGFCGETTYRWLYSGIRAGDDGTFKLNGLPEKRVVVEAGLSGYSDIDGLVLEVDRTDHVVTLKSQGEIAGKVVRADDEEPVTSFKARVTFSNSRKPGDISSGLLFSQTDGIDFTPADGAFLISHLTNGATYRVEIDAPGYRRAAVDRVLVQPKGKSDASQVVFRLHPATGFEGVITDQETGKPIEDVLVTVIDKEGGAGGHFQWRQISEMREYTKPARSDSQGRFKLESVGSRSGLLMLEKAGYARTLASNVDFGKPFKYALSKAASVSGIVTDESGKPIHGCAVSVECLGEGRQMISYDCLTTDAEGRFRAENLPGGRFMVQQRGNSDMKKMIEVDIAAGEDFVVDWNRPGEAALEGLVTLEGQPVEKAHIIIHPVDGWMYSGFADTGKDGSYRVPLYRAGGYKVTISQGEWMDPNHIWIKKIVQVAPGTNRLNVEFPSGAISGHVLDIQGNPVSGLLVRAYHRLTEEAKIGAQREWSWQHTEPIWWPENTATTDASGAFQVKNIAGGEWLVAAANGEPVSGHSNPFVLADDQKKTDVLIRLPEPGRAEVGIVDPTTGGTPEDSYPVLVDDSGFIYYPAKEEDNAPRLQDAAPDRARTPEGRFVFSSIPPGDYRATVMMGVYRTSGAEAEVKVISGGTAIADIRPAVLPRIVFKLSETKDDAMHGVPWIGYTITTAGSAEPVLKDFQGPILGSLIFFEGDYPRKAVIAIRPGKYDLKAGLRTESSSGVIMANEDLWSYTGTIEVKAGEDLEIEVNCR